MWFIFALACTSSKGEEPTAEEEAPPSNACVQIDLGSAIGEPVQTGTLTPGVGRFGYCGEIELGMGSDSGDYYSWGGLEKIFVWTAPSSSTFTVYTLGSQYDTTLSLKGACAGPSMACDDDGGRNLDSLLTFSATEGQSYIIILDAYSSYEGGEWVLNIIEGNREDIGWPADTGWHDTGRWDTGWKSHSSQQNYGCEVPEWGLCYDQFRRDGWDDMSALESCTDLAIAYGLKTNFQSGMGCINAQTVGECHIERNGYFQTATVTRYERGKWRLEDARKACDKAHGTFYNH